MIKPSPSYSIQQRALKRVQHAMAIASFGVVIALSGCQALGVYTIDLPQGTPITANQAQKLQVGMNQNQVLYILGSPAIKDTMAPNRWDYIYDYQAGTDGRRAGRADIKNAEQHLKVYFDNNGIVTRIEGIETLPVK